MEQKRSRAFYQSTIKRIPPRVIANVGDLFTSIAALADSEAIGVAHTLICSIMRSKDNLEGLERWARHHCYLVNGEMGSEDLEKYLQLRSFGLSLVLKLKEMKLYFHGVLPYKCEEVLEDGSLLLARVDKFEEFERLSQS